MDTELRDALNDRRPWPWLVTRLLVGMDDLGHQVGLPDRLQDRLCQKLDRHLQGWPPNEQQNGQATG